MVCNGPVTVNVAAWVVVASYEYKGGIAVDLGTADGLGLGPDHLRKMAAHFVGVATVVLPVIVVLLLGPLVHSLLDCPLSLPDE